MGDKTRRAMPGAVSLPMRLMTRLLVTLLAGAPLCAGQASSAVVTPSPSGLQSTLFVLVNEFMTNWQKHDFAAMAAPLAPEFVYVSPQGVTLREAVVQDLSTHCDLKSYSLGEPKMVRTGEDAAVLIYTIHQDLTCFGHPEATDVVNSDTFVRRGGGWMFAMTTSTPLARH